MRRWFLKYVRADAWEFSAAQGLMLKRRSVVNPAQDALYVDNWEALAAWFYRWVCVESEEERFCAAMFFEIRLRGCVGVERAQGLMQIGRAHV